MKAGGTDHALQGQFRKFGLPRGRPPCEELKAKSF